MSKNNRDRAMAKVEALAVKVETDHARGEPSEHLTALQAAMADLTIHDRQAFHDVNVGTLT